MNARTRPLSARVREELDDIGSYAHTLDPKTRQWLEENYVDPELRQRFPQRFPQAQKRRIWKQAKAELRCVDGVPGWLQYDSDLLEPFATADAELKASISTFLDTLKK